MNTNIENFYESQALRQMEFENFIKSEAHNHDLLCIKNDEEYAESRLQARIEDAELRSEFETYNWNL